MYVISDRNAVSMGELHDEMDDTRHRRLHPVFAVRVGAILNGNLRDDDREYHLRYLPRRNVSLDSRRND